MLKAFLNCLLVVCSTSESLDWPKSIGAPKPESRELNDWMVPPGVDPSAGWSSGEYVEWKVKRSLCRETTAENPFKIPKVSNQFKLVRHKPGVKSLSCKMNGKGTDM